MRRAFICTTVGVILLAVATAESRAQSAGRALTIEDYYRVLEVGAPQMSPDGRWVAYTVSRKIEATNGDSSEVWLVATDGAGAPRRVSGVGSHATNPQWSGSTLRFNASGKAWTIDPASQQEPVDAGAPAGGGGGRGGRAGGGGDQRLTSLDGRSTAMVRSMRPPALVPQIRR